MFTCNIARFNPLAVRTLFPYLENNDRFTPNLSKRLRTGFTLIELLVVVLIIGVLAAVALPQYQLTVAKSRYVQAITLGGKVWEAQQVFYLANGHHASSFADLDIAMPDGQKIPNYEALSFPWGQCYMEGVKEQEDGSFSAGVGIDCRIFPDSSLWYIQNFTPNGARMCWAFSERKHSNIAKKVCESFANPTKASYFAPDDKSWRYFL